MSKKSVLFLAVLLLAPIVLYFLWPSDEARIRRLFREGAQAVESRKVEAVLDKVSFSYADGNGLNYFGLKEMIKAVFAREKEIHVSYKIDRLDISGKTARAELKVNLSRTGGPAADLLPGRQDEPIVMTFTIEKEHGKWLITKTEGLPMVY